MAELENVEVLNSQVEYSAWFAKPAFELPDSWGRLHSAMVQALGPPWHLGSQGITFRTDPANLSEVRVNYRLPDSRFLFSVGVESATAELSNVGWNELSHFLPAVERGLAAACATLGVTVESQTVTLAMHIKSQERTALGVLERFVQAGLLVPPGEKMKDCGLSIQTNVGTYSLEPSLRFVGALYISVGRRYSGGQSLPEIARETHTTEIHFLNALGFTLIGENVPAVK